LANVATSSNDTTIMPGSGSITDSSGDVFTISDAGTVDMNGGPLGYTANVIEAAYVNGNLWQENSSNLWWEYTGNPSAPWTGLGTSTSPLPASPNNAAITPGSGSITDSHGNVFTITAGGTVDMDGQPLGYTANVIEGAYVNGQFWQESSSGLWWEYQGSSSAPWTGLGTSTSPLTGPASLDFGPGNATATLTGSSYAINEAATEYTDGNTPATVTLNLTNPNVSANLTATGGIGVADAYYNYTNPATLTVNFAGHLTTTSMNAHAGELTLNGPQLDNAGTVYLIASHAQINADVVGTGTWNLQLADLTLDGPVGTGQTFDVQTVPSNVTLDDPKEFHGLLNVGLPEFGSVTLADLTATSYSYVNNVLTLYDGRYSIDNLRIADNSTFGVYHTGAGIVISNQTPSGGTAIPIHTTGT
jgi:hypothetical protein